MRHVYTQKERLIAYCSQLASAGIIQASPDLPSEHKSKETKHHKVVYTVKQNGITLHLETSPKIK